VTTLVPCCVLWNLNLPLTRPLAFFCN
jgi:hypothetical protein